MSIRTAVAQVPSDGGDDRVVVTHDAVILLDGASGSSAFTVTAGEFAEHLGQNIAREITGGRRTSLVSCLAHAIETTSENLDLRQGGEPSATVSIARATDGRVEVLVLGDSPVVVGGRSSHEVVSDSRIDELALPDVRRYRERLVEGHGYDAEHERLLARLRLVQAGYRNKDGGFWVASADPAAARHAVLRTFDASQVAWVVLASDGAAKPLTHLAWDDWSSIAYLDQAALQALLVKCYEWERAVDPNGAMMPRSKRHDDMSLVSVRLHDNRGNQPAIGVGER